MLMPSPLPRPTFGREERLEDTREHDRRHARAVVLDRATHIGTRCQVGELRNRVCGEPNVFGLDREPSPLLHRVSRIDREVQDRVLHLRWIDITLPQPGLVHDPGREILS
jgi:hypothetical protein